MKQAAETREPVPRTAIFSSSSGGKAGCHGDQLPVPGSSDEGATAVLSRTEGSKGLRGGCEGGMGTSAVGGTAFLTVLPTDKADRGKTQQRRQRERGGLGETGIETGKGEESGTGSRRGEDAQHSLVRIRGGTSETPKCSFERNSLVIERLPVSPSFG